MSILAHQCRYHMRPQTNIQQRKPATGTRTARRRYGRTRVMEYVEKQTEFAGCRQEAPWGHIALALRRLTRPDTRRGFLTTHLELDWNLIGTHMLGTVLCRRAHRAVRLSWCLPKQESLKTLHQLSGRKAVYRRETVDKGWALMNLCE